jgi:hypothetical protein
MRARFFPKRIAHGKLSLKATKAKERKKLPSIVKEGVKARAQKTPLLFLGGGGRAGAVAGVVERRRRKNGFSCHRLQPPPSRTTHRTPSLSRRGVERQKCREENKTPLLSQGGGAGE